MTREQLQNVQLQFALSDGTILPETGKLDFADRNVDPQPVP